MHTPHAMQILIIDDDDEAQAILADVLTPQGHTILAADSGAEGLRQASVHQPDLILLDAVMPEMDGFDVCTQLRAAPHTAEVPIVMITAEDSHDARLRGIRAGADEWLAKPLNVRELLVWVQMFARLDQCRKAIKERDEAIVALTLARDAAQQISQRKTAIITNMSNELYTPLTNVIGMSELLITTLLDKGQREFVNSVLESSAKLLATIDTMVDYTSLEDGNYAFVMSAFDPAAAIGAVVGAVRPVAQASGCTLDLTIDPRLATVVKGDMARLQLVMRTLMDYAIASCAQGTVAIAAELIAGPAEEQRLCFQIRDAGHVLTADQQAQLFQPFQREHGYGARRPGGTAMGLAISKRVIELLGGVISVASEAGQGTTFSVQVPLYKYAPFVPKRPRPSIEFVPAPR